MCGIAGVFSLDDAPVQVDWVRAMCAAIVHRGPDDEGFYAEAGVAMGMRRLSIIDLEGGHQPVHNEDRTVWVVFNGEIYNFRELRRDLIRRGHQLATDGDTETIVHLYEEYGDGCVAHLRGMFAFAIWDRRRQRLLLARDRLGIKPLYYAQHGKYLYFGSEVKALLQIPALERRLNWRAVGHLFTFLSTPRDESIVAGVRKLAPAHTLSASASEGLAIRQYWSVHFEPDRRQTEQEAAERLTAMVDESVAEHLVSDVPLGAFLSGGIDSSAVVASMSRTGTGPVKTFSIGFPEPEYSELAHAREISRRFGTEHHELVLEPNVMGVLDDLVWHLDEPFGDSSAIPTYMVSRLAAEHVTVVLSGDGGDELFAGYDRYRVEQHERRFEAIPQWLRSAAAAMATALPESARGRNFIRHYGLSGWARYVDAATLFRHEQRRRLFQPDVAALWAEEDEPGVALRRELEQKPGHWLSAMQAIDLERYLPLDILTKVDRMSMAHSIEARVPLLDHRLVEFAAALPPEWQMRDGVGKHLFKRSLAGRLPDGILHRRKQGFAVPLERWFRGSLGPFVRSLLIESDSPRRALLDTGYIEQLIARQAHGRALALHMWTLISFELWCRRFLDEKPAPVARPTRQRQPSLVFTPDAPRGVPADVAAAGGLA